MSDKLPGKGLFGWLGRQVGYVSKAVKARPAALPAAKPSAPQSAPRAPSEATEPAGEVLYRQGQVQEAEHPTAGREASPHDHRRSDRRPRRAGTRRRTGIAKSGRVRREIQC